MASRAGNGLGFLCFGSCCLAAHHIHGAVETPLMERMAGCSNMLDMFWTPTKTWKWWQFPGKGDAFSVCVNDHVQVPYIYIYIFFFFLGGGLNIFQLFWFKIVFCSKLFVYCIFYPDPCEMIPIFTIFYITGMEPPQVRCPHTKRRFPQRGVQSLPGNESHRDEAIILWSLNPLGVFF